MAYISGTSSIEDIELAELEKLAGCPLLVLVEHNSGVWTTAIFPKPKRGEKAQEPEEYHVSKDLKLALEEMVVRFIARQLRRTSHAS